MGEDKEQTRLMELAAFQFVSLLSLIVFINIMYQVAKRAENKSLKQPSLYL